MSDPVSLFEPAEGGTWLPTAYARGPWSPDALHGGPTAALLAGVAEATGREAADGRPMHPARLTVELLRPVPLAPLAVEARVVRPGRKVQLVDVSMRTADGTEVASARLLQIREAAVEAPVTTAIAGPPGPETEHRPMADRVGYDAFHNCGAEHHFVVGSFMDAGPATDWIRLRVPVVPDVEPTPLQRVAAAADFGNGVSRVADFSELTFINPDLTIHLHRSPVGEWVCLEAVTWMEDHGAALAESRLWDERGPIGRSLQSLLIDDRTPGGTPA